MNYPFKSSIVIKKEEKETDRQTDRTGNRTEQERAKSERERYTKPLTGTLKEHLSIAEPPHVRLVILAPGDSHGVGRRVETHAEHGPCSDPRWCMLMFTG